MNNMMPLVRLIQLVVLVAVSGCVHQTVSENSTSSKPMQTSIVQAGTPVLRERAATVAAKTIQTPEMQALIQQMISTMRDAPGVGLAAPQIGIGLRIIVLEDRAERLVHLSPQELAEREREPFAVRVFINPTLTPIGDEKVGFFEGCLSVSGWTGYVERYREVEVSGLDETGTPQIWRVRGWPARILQHEVDHINGTLYIDKMVTRSFATQDLARARYTGKTAAEVRAMLDPSAKPTL